MILHLYTDNNNEVFITKKTQIMKTVATIKTELVLDEKTTMTSVMIFSSLKKALSHFETTKKDLSNYIDGNGSFQLEKTNLKNYYFGSGYDDKNRFVAIAIGVDEVY